MSPRVAMKLHPEGECAMGSNPEGEARGMRTHCTFTQGMQFHCLPRAHLAILLSQGLLYKSHKNNLFSDKKQHFEQLLQKNSSNQLNFKHFVKDFQKFRQIDEIFGWQ